MASRNTISDVARAAGVSIKTVSRVLNKERYVRADTRHKVEAAMAALAFSPSLAARSLAGNRSHQIALIRFPVRDPCRAEDSTRSIDRVERRQRSDLRTAPAPDARERVASFDPPL